MGELYKFDIKLESAKDCTDYWNEEYDWFWSVAGEYLMRLRLYV